MEMLKHPHYSNAVTKFIISKTLILFAMKLAALVVSRGKASLHMTFITRDFYARELVRFCQ